ncbi:Uncharacterized protein M6B38_218935 [Iris pallida]|uniref:GBF-interacting protein 1 N-terminal domain-containing protein n=1 Tax=Iris pallida TaxID=29817 RepID=A0AAX6DXK3_IRIPA|nr:Uncharacterized protein M6B38_218935 [Iris pallida]
MSGGGKRAAVGTTSSASIPSGSKKMVQSIREIVNCSEMEIYSMLKECNMDPSEAVHRLLTQDTFHEVKSKKEKKKEPKDIPESRSRAPNNNSNRGPRGGADRGVRVNSTQISLNDYGVAHGKLAHKKENGAHSVPPSSVVVSNASGSNLNRKSPKLCEVISMDNTTEATGTTGGLLPSQPSPGFQHNWSRAPGQLSMADIVKMGKPQGKPSSTPSVANDLFHPLHDPILTNVLHHNTKWPSTMIPPSEPDPDFLTSQGPVPQDDEISHELGTGQHISHDGWSLADNMPAESGTDYPQTTSASSIYADPSTSSTLLADEVNSHLGSHSAENQAIEGHVNGDSLLLTESTRAAPLSDRVLEVDKFGHSSHLDDGMLSGIDSYHTFEHHEVVDTDEEISSAAQNLQQLNLQKGELGVASAEENPAVIIPSHLQVTNADCSHLSFGSFGSGMSATFCGLPSQSLTSNLEVAQVAEDAPSFDQSHSRTTEYYDNDQLESSLNENLGSRNSLSPRSYDMPPATQPDTVREESLDAAHRIEGNFPSVSDYGYSATTQQTAAAYAYPESNAEMQNLSPFSSLMQPYTNSLPSSLLAQTAQQPHRELDHPFSALLPTQSMPLKYSTTTSSINGPTISIPEGQSEVYSTPQSTLQAVPNSNIPGGGGPALPQHLPLHPYSQPTLPLGHFANMIGYPFLPQSYTFLPSAAYQQAYPGNSPFHQSPAAGMKYTLPQYKSSVPGGTGLPQSPALPPGYGGLSNLTNSIPGSFSLNPTPASTTPSVDEAMSSLYKEGSHYLPLQQNENSAMWLHGGAGSRAMSALPASTFYGFQGQQNQHNGGYRQVQQQASPYGPMGYMNFYQSQGGPTQERHQQNPSEGNLSGSQGPTSHQLWQHGY